MPKPAGLTFEQAAALPVSGGHRAAGRAGPGQGAGRAARHGHRRRRRHRHVRRAAREGARRERDRRVRPGEGGTGALDRRRHVIDYTRTEIGASGDRYDVIIDTPAAARCPCCGAPWRPAAPWCWRAATATTARCSTGMARQASIPFLSLFTRQRLRSLHRQGERRRLPGPGRARRVRHDHAGHRPHLPARRRRRRHPRHRRRARVRQGRNHHLTGPQPLRLTGPQTAAGPAARP